MALLWIEGFEGFGTTIGGAPSPTGIIGRKYPIVNREAFMDIETGRYGNCLEVDPLGYLQSPHLTTDDTCIIGMAIYIPLCTVDTHIIKLYEGANLGVNFSVTSAGYITAKMNTITLATSTSAVPFDTWFYFEAKVLTSNTVGTVDVKVNGTSFISLTNQDTQPGSNAYHTAFRLADAVYNGVVVKFDDLYFLDGSGSVNNDFLGNRKVIALDPDGAGDSTDWTPSAGSNYENVNDGGLLDEDTTYNETSTDADDDLYTYDNLPGVTASVDGIQITTETRVTAGSMDLSNLIKTGTTIYPGTADTITSTSYVTTIRVEEQDPDTVAAWTPSGVNDAQFGIRANT